MGDYSPLGMEVRADVQSQVGPQFVAFYVDLKSGEVFRTLGPKQMLTETASTVSGTVKTFAYEYKKKKDPFELQVGFSFDSETGQITKIFGKTTVINHRRLRRDHSTVLDNITDQCANLKFVSTDIKVDQASDPASR